MHKYDIILKKESRSIHTNALFIKKTINVSLFLPKALEIVVQISIIIKYNCKFDICVLYVEILF